MYILDTDHLSVLERGGVAAQPLVKELAAINPDQVFASIISYEEQTRGWMSEIQRREKKVESQVEAYQELKRQLTNYCSIPIVEFDLQAIQEFHKLKKRYQRLGTMDLKIAAIALVNQAVLLTRNASDFGQIAGLRIEDWTI